MTKYVRKKTQKVIILHCVVWSFCCNILLITRSVHSALFCLFSGAPNIYLLPDFCIWFIIVGRVRGNAIPAVPLVDQNNLLGTGSPCVSNPRLFEARAIAIGPLCHLLPCECGDTNQWLVVGYWTASCIAVPWAWRCSAHAIPTLNQVFLKQWRIQKGKVPLALKTKTDFCKILQKYIKQTNAMKLIFLGIAPRYPFPLGNIPYRPNLPVIFSL